VLWFMSVGACNGAGILAMYAALARGQVSVVSPLVATYPLFTLALSAVFLREEKLGRACSRRRADGRGRGVLARG